MMRRMNFFVFSFWTLGFTFDSVWTLPPFVHLHTEDEIQATNIVLLNKQCIGPNGGLVILVKSSPSNNSSRDSIRKTWGHDARENRIPVLFILGNSSEEVMRNVLLEDTIHEDILVGNFVDNYYNLTLKGVFLLSWVRTYCNKTWILYVDDDVILNVAKVIDFVRNQKSTSRNIYCLVKHRAPVVRYPSSKWFVSRSVYSSNHHNSDTYPDYCLGIGYLMSPSIIEDLHEAAVRPSTQPKLWIDDVFLTGIAVEKANITLISTKEFRCCGTQVIKWYNSSIVMGEVGKGSSLKKHWSWMNLTRLSDKIEGIDMNHTVSIYMLILFASFVLIAIFMMRQARKTSRMT